MMTTGFTINLGNLFGPSTEQKREEGRENIERQEPRKYSTEFHEIYHEFVNDIASFRDKYPLTVLISMVFFAWLGVSSLFHFSLTGIFSCVIYCVVATSLAKSIGKKGTAFWCNVKDSLLRTFQASGKKLEETTRKRQSEGQPVST